MKRVKFIQNILGTIVISLSFIYAHNDVGIKNIIDFGADPTGISDATNAIQNAINSLNPEVGGKVFIPAGTYRIDGTIYCFPTPNNGISVVPHPLYTLIIEGVGISDPNLSTGTSTGGSCLRKQGGGDIFRSGFTADNHHITYNNAVCIIGLNFEIALGNNNIVYGIRGHRALRSKITDCNFRGLDYGIHFNNSADGIDDYSDGLLLENLNFSGIKNTAIEISSADFSRISKINISEPNGMQYGLKILGGSSSFFDNILINGAVGTSIGIYGAHSLQLSGLHFEGGPKGHIYYIYDCNNININNSYSDFDYSVLFYINQSYNCELKNHTTRIYKNTIDNLDNRDVYVYSDPAYPIKPYGISYPNLQFIEVDNNWPQRPYRKARIDSYITPSSGVFVQDDACLNPNDPFIKLTHFNQGVNNFSDLFKVSMNGDIYSSGKGGIGTTSPSSKLEVQAAGPETDPTTLRVSSTNVGGGDSKLSLCQAPGSDDFRFFMAGVDSRTDGRVANDGYVEHSQGLETRIYGNTSNYLANQIMRRDYSNNGGYISWGVSANNTSDAVEKMSLTGNGDLGIGTTTPATKLHVVGATKLQGNVEVTGTLTTGICQPSSIQTNTITSTSISTGTLTSSGNATVNGTLTIGTGGNSITKFLSNFITWNPNSIANGAMTSTTVTVNGAAVGDPVICGQTTLNVAGLQLTAAVTAANTVTVSLVNHSGTTKDIASGTLKVGVWKF